MLNDVKPENTFWMKGGKPIKNIAELGRELKQMNNETFNHHVNDSKNDFASWIEFCVKDKQLATLVKTTKNPERMSAIVERRIQEMTAIPIKQEPPKKEAPEPRKRVQQAYQPTIIRTKNVTQLSFKPEVIKTPNITQLKLSNQVIKTGKTTQLAIAEQKAVIKTKHKTLLKLSTKENEKEIIIHEGKPHHYSIVLLASHLVLGLVVGVAIAIMVLAFNT
jgi:hypothetical protein